MSASPAYAKAAAAYAAATPLTVPALRRLGIVCYDGGFDGDRPLVVRWAYGTLFVADRSGVQTVGNPGVFRETRRPFATAAEAAAFLDGLTADLPGFTTYANG